jgi:Leu/Phe-tRNA-protein transferase
MCRNNIPGGGGGGGLGKEFVTESQFLRDNNSKTANDVLCDRAHRNNSCFLL